MRLLGAAAYHFNVTVVGGSLLRFERRRQERTNTIARPMVASSTAAIGIAEPTHFTDPPAASPSPTMALIAADRPSATRLDHAAGWAVTNPVFFA